MRRPTRGLISTLGASLIAIAAHDTKEADATQAGRFVKSADGLTVHDNVLHVTWLADAELPGDTEVRPADQGQRSDDVSDRPAMGRRAQREQSRRGIPGPQELDAARRLRRPTRRAASREGRTAIPSGSIA